MALRAGGGPLVLRRDLGVAGPVQGQRAFGSPIYGARLASPVAGTVLLRGQDGALSLRLVLAGAQSLTLPFLADADTLFAPVVAPGSVSLSLPFIASGGVLYAPVVSLGGGAQSLTLPFLADADSLFGPVVAPGPVSLVLPFLVDADLLFSPFVTLPVLPPAERVVLVAASSRAETVEALVRSAAPEALARAAWVEGLPRSLAPGARARIILIT